MAGGKYRVVNGGVFLNVLSQAEKGGAGIMPGKQLEQAGGAFWMGSVVEGEVNGLFFSGTGEGDAGQNRVGDICCLPVKHLLKVIVQSCSFFT